MARSDEAFKQSSSRIFDMFDYSPSRLDSVAPAQSRDDFVMVSVGLRIDITRSGSDVMQAITFLQMAHHK